MKLFAISDVHGFYQPMIEALNKAGFDENNPDHLLVSLGDEFDRGPDAVAVYGYLRRLHKAGKAIVIKGNHSHFLIGYLTGENISPFNYYRNGTGETLADFLHQTMPFESWCALQDKDSPTYKDFADWVEIARNKINGEYPELLGWLDTRPYYFETKNYIFSHGSIDGTCEDWHYPKKDVLGRFLDWEACMWDDGSFFGSEITNTNKTVVIGHFGTEHLRRMYGIKHDKNPNDILTRSDGRVIAIDATTVLSHKVNVLVVEDELLDTEVED